MIKSVTLTNFFSFKHETIILNPYVNILVGINGSGKSNFLKAIKLLKEGMAGSGLKKLIQDSWGGYDCVKYYDTENSSNTTIEFCFDHKVFQNGFKFENDVYYKIVIHANPRTNYTIEELLYTKNLKNDEQFIFLHIKNGKGFLSERNLEKGKISSKIEEFDEQELSLSRVFETERFYPQFTVKKTLEELAVYDYFDTRPFSLMRRPVPATGEKRLLSEGTNLVQIINTIRNNNKSDFRKIIEAIKQINPFFEGINYNPVGINIELTLEETGLEKSIIPAHISDGTLRYLCLTSIFFNKSRGKTIAIDEPELGLHPDMIRRVCNMIHDTCEETQTIITTHSPAILNNFNLENIIVFDKNENNSTTATTFSEEEFEGWLEKFRPGTMWRNGHIGGNVW